MTNQRLTDVIAAVDKINQQDPNREEFQGKNYAKEYLYSMRMSVMLDKYWPDSDEYLKIAVRAQHIKRWHIPRINFPQGKEGYLLWRKELGIYHAQLAAQLMLDQGYSEHEAQLTANIIKKEKFKRNHDAQTLEDVACLVFLSHYFDAFAKKHEEDKIISILQKTWKKMSARGHEIALTLKLPDHLANLVNKALS